MGRDGGFPVQLAVRVLAAHQAVGALRTVCKYISEPCKKYVRFATSLTSKASCLSRSRCITPSAHSEQGNTVVCSSARDSTRLRASMCWHSSLCSCASRFSTAKVDGQ